MSTYPQFGFRGSEVVAWQQHLVRQGYLSDPPDGTFGPRTRSATVRFQLSHRLTADGVVGPRTLAAAQAAERPAAPPPPTVPSAAPATDRAPPAPPRPPFSPLQGQGARERLFGRFDYAAAPTAQNPEAIKVDHAWLAENLVTVEVPQLGGIPYGWGGTASSRLAFHRKAASQMQGLWRAWQAAGLLARVLTFDGGYAARFVRKAPGQLSPHAFGTAFDINAQWNGLGRTPARWGERGSVADLVGIANDHGFYWGGHFTRLDGMHFEIAQLR